MGQTSILLIEPGTAAWAPVRATLEKADRFRIAAFSTPPAAERHLRGDRADIALVDHEILKAKGHNLVSRLKECVPHIETLCVGSEIGLDEGVAMMRSGVCDVVSLPVSPDDLLRRIERALGKRAVDAARQIHGSRSDFDPDGIVGRSKPMQHIVRLARSVAPKDATVLITGETGTGKELMADAIHFNSRRASRPYVKVSCAAFNEGVLESELFGHERGAFTGAVAQRLGRFELADGGTLFLDEIGDLSLSTQVKLLRVLQKNEFERVGGNRTIRTDVRIIAATHRNLRQLIPEGRFREDLFYRLNVVSMEVPPLRERKEDIPLLVEGFLRKMNEAKGYAVTEISKEAMKIFLAYDWPGNVRELENAVESAMALSTSATINARVLPSFLLLPPARQIDYYHIPKTLPLKEIRSEIVRLVLEEEKGNRTRTARRLGIGLRTLQRWTTTVRD